MEREIEFRAYIRDINSIIPVKSIDFYKELVQLDAELPYGGILKLHEIELMQYTGLKDENNKEIYEGYIIKEDGWDDVFYLIVFKDCKFIAKKIGHHTGDIWTKRDKDLGDVLWPVVVGNKYENPELLKEGE